MEVLSNYQRDLLMCIPAHKALLFLHGGWGESLEDSWEYPLVKHAEKVTVHFQLTSLKGWSSITHSRHLGHLKTTSNFPVNAKAQSTSQLYFVMGVSEFLIPGN